MAMEHHGYQHFEVDTSIIVLPIKLITYRGRRSAFFYDTWRGGRYSFRRTVILKKTSLTLFLAVGINRRRHAVSQQVFDSSAPLPLFRRCSSSHNCSGDHACLNTAATLRTQDDIPNP